MVPGSAQSVGAAFSVGTHQYCRPQPARLLRAVAAWHPSLTQDVGGATRSALQAAAAAAARPPHAPYRLARWRHVSTGDLLELPVPTSVFAKQDGTVWAKWRQRAWRGLYSLACQVGDPQEPPGCRDPAGHPLWDDLEEENAALDKLPFCIPQKVAGKGPVALEGACVRAGRADWSARAVQPACSGCRMHAAKCNIYVVERGSIRLQLGALKAVLWATQALAARCAGAQEHPPLRPGCLTSDVCCACCARAPPQCRAQMLGLGTTERLKSTLLW